MVVKQPSGPTTHQAKQRDLTANMAMQNADADCDRGNEKTRDPLHDCVDTLMPTGRHVRRVQSTVDGEAKRVGGAEVVGKWREGGTENMSSVIPR